MSFNVTVCLCVHVIMCLGASVSECTLHCACVPVYMLVCIPASAECLRERRLQKASGKESQSNKGNLASGDVLSYNHCSGEKCNLLCVDGYVCVG